MSQEIRDRIIRLAAMIEYKKYAAGPIRFRDVLDLVKTPNKIIPFVLSHVKLIHIGKAKSMGDDVKNMVSGYSSKDEAARKEVAKKLIKIIESNEDIFKSGVSYPKSDDEMVKMLDSSLGKTASSGGVVKVARPAGDCWPPWQGDGNHKYSKDDADVDLEEEKGDDMEEDENNSGFVL